MISAIDVISQKGRYFSMSDTPNNTNQSSGAAKLTWQTPTIHEDVIGDATNHFFSAGVDNYEGDNPVGYGS